MELKGRQKHSMQIENPQFSILQSLRSQRKLKRYHKGSVLEVADIKKFTFSKKLKRSTSFIDTSFSKIDMTKEARQRRKTSNNNFSGLKFQSIVKRTLRRIGTKGSQNSSISRKPKLKNYMNKLNTISI